VSDFLLLLLIVVIVAVLVLAFRLRRLSVRLVEYRWSGSKDLEMLERRLARLTERVFALEKEGPIPKAEPAPKDQPEELAKPVPDEAPPAPPSAVPAPVVPVHDDLAPAEAEVEAEPTREWESLVGGSLLNKAGVLVTVIGIALFLGYSFSRLSPVGRVGLAAAVSFALLAAGVVMERIPRYVMFARGLIGGGWAAVYFTAYAAHGLSAARVIHDPILATELLLVVSVACILHTLRYRSEVVSGLAYFVGFITLAVTRLDVFAMIALMPLAASLLYLAKRFAWGRLALPGLLATYGLYFAHAARSPEGSLWAGQSLLLIYWVLFEGFDIITSRADDGPGMVRGLLFPANAAAFLGISWLQWYAVSPDALYVPSALAAAAYLVSTLVRVYSGGGYQGALAMAAGAAVVGAFQRLDGLAVTCALIAEAELIFLAGLVSRRPFVKWVSEAVFAVAIGKLFLVDVLDGGSFVLASIVWYIWTPVALLIAALLYANRKLVPERRVYGYVAAALVTLVAGFELPLEYIGAGLLVLSGLLFEFGVTRRLADFRYQAYAVGVASLIPMLAVNVLGLGLDGASSPWVPQLLAVAMLAAAVIRLDRFDGQKSESRLLPYAREVATYAAAAMSTVLLWNVLPASAVAVGWAALGLAFLGLARLSNRPGPRLRSYTLAILSFFRAWAVNLEAPDPSLDPATRILLAIGVIVAFYVATLLCPRLEDLPSAAGWRHTVETLGRPGYAVLASALLVLFLSYEVSGSMLTVAWGAQGLALLIAGFLIRDRSLRLPGLVVLVGCILKLFAYDLRNLETPARIASFLVLGVILIGVSWGYTRYRERLSKLLH